MKISKFAEARRSAPLNRLLYSPAAEVRAGVKEIVEEIVESGKVYKRPPSKKSRLVAAVQLLVLNFLRLRYSDPKRLLAAGFRKSDYASGPVSYLHMRKARDGMLNIGLLELAENGFYDPKTGKGLRSRYRAGARLFEICVKHQVRPCMILAKERRALVQLRGKKSENGEAQIVAWPRASKGEQRAMTSNLRKINQALRESLVALHVPDTTLDQIQVDLGHRDGYIDFFDKDLYRVFNDGNPHLGGRFYGGWWQNVPSEYRKFIHIIQPGTWPTYNREIDYSGMQPRILYAEQGLVGGDDLYAMAKYDTAVNEAARNVVKMLLLQMLNAESEEKALDAAKSEIVKNCDDKWAKAHPSKKRPKMTIEEMLPQGCPPLKQLMADIKEQHQPIATHFCSGAGKRLMYADSMIAEAVMLRMIDAGAVILPIHDSFIVRHEFADKLKEAMRDEFCKFTGFDAPTKLDESELEAHKKARGPMRIEARGYLQTNTEATERKRREYSIYTTLKEDWMASDKRAHPKLMSKGIPNELYTAPFGRRYHSTRRKLTA